MPGADLLNCHIRKLKHNDFYEWFWSHWFVELSKLEMESHRYYCFSCKLGNRKQQMEQSTKKAWDLLVELSKLEGYQLLSELASNIS